MRKDHTGRTYGNEWIKTPNFDEFAKDSIVFDKAYPESLPTIPVRRAIHTGIRTFPFNHQRPKLRTDNLVKAPGWHPILPQQKHLSEYLNNLDLLLPQEAIERRLSDWERPEANIKTGYLNIYRKIVSSAKYGAYLNYDR